MVVAAARILGAFEALAHPVHSAFPGDSMAGAAPGSLAVVVVVVRNLERDSFGRTFGVAAVASGAGDRASLHRSWAVDSTADRASQASDWERRGAQREDLPDTTDIARLWKMIHSGELKENSWAIASPLYLLLYLSAISAGMGWMKRVE